MGTHPIFESDFDCLTEMDRVSLMRQSSSRTRTISSTGRCANGPRRGRLETAALILAAGDFDDTSLNPIGHGRKSKALLPVGNKPQLFHTIELLESSGFDKEAITRAEHAKSQRSPIEQ